jgi:Resolvase, N terminal domain
MANGILQQSLRVAIYARVSTANNGQDPTMQTRELLEYCQRRGWELSGEPYVDIGISGTGSLCFARNLWRYPLKPRQATGNIRG